MSAIVNQHAPTVAVPTKQSSPKRPRLSLNTQSSTTAPGVSSAAMKVEVDTASPIAFNTLSNAYLAAIEASSPKTTSRPPAFDLLSKTSSKPTSLRVVTNSSEHPIFPSQRTQTPGPFATPHSATPSSAISPAFQKGMVPPSAGFFAQTPVTTPSIHSTDHVISNSLISKSSSAPTTPSSPRRLRRRATLDSGSMTVPYAHPHALRSILRNSPLPTRHLPPSPPRALQSVDRSLKRVNYNDPLTQTITTQRYIRSHVDLLAEGLSASPSPVDVSAVSSASTLFFPSNDIKDGGQTPGPFEEMRRRLAGLGDTCDGDLMSPGSRKRKRGEKKRNWVWTIGVNEEDTESRVASPLLDDKQEISSSVSKMPDESTHLPMLQPTVYEPVRGLALEITLHVLQQMDTSQTSKGHDPVLVDPCRKDVRSDSAHSM